MDTGIAADTAMHTFRVEHGASSYKFFIDRVLVATITTTLPADSTATFDILQFDAPGTSARKPGFRCGYIYWWSKQ